MNDPIITRNETTTIEYIIRVKMLGRGWCFYNSYSNDKGIEGEIEAVKMWAGGDFQKIKVEKKTKVVQRTTKVEILFEE